MRKLNLRFIILSCLITTFSINNISAQNSTGDIAQDPKIDQLLEIKTKMTKDNEIGDRYIIQLFYGDNGEADKVIKEYRSKYDYPSLIAYEAPNYKVWVGNFRNRLEADRALLKIKETFPTAFIPKPRRR